MPIIRPSVIPGKIFCFGYGYVAQALAEKLTPLGWQIVGTSRSPGADYLFDTATPLPPDAWEGVTHLLHSIPPDETGDAVLQHYGDRLPDSLQWVGYLSATSVYGDTRGMSGRFPGANADNITSEWVDETAPTDPPTERGKRRLAAERAWLEQWQKHGVPIHIFRLAGIYGPGRNAIANMLAGKARRIFKEGHVFSRIHRDDIVETLLASMAQPNPGSVYNVADNLPAPAFEVVEYACHLLGVVPPPLLQLEEADLTPMARSFYEASRRVDNRKIREELGVALCYPDYRRGLDALLPKEQKTENKLGGQ